VKANNYGLTGLGPFAPQPNASLAESQQVIEALCTIQCVVASLPCTATAMRRHFLALYSTRNAEFRPAAALLDVKTKQTQPGWSTDLFPTQSAWHNVAWSVLAVQLDAREGSRAGQQLGSQAHVSRQAAAVLRNHHSAAHCQLVHSTHLQQLPPVGLYLLC